jgi:uncharacterized protein (DUF1800 family)
MERRTFLHLRSKESEPAAIQLPKAQTTDAGLEPYEGPWETAQVTHLLRRTLFGAKWEDIRFFLEMSPGEAVQYLLASPPSPPPPPVNDYNGENDFIDPDVPAGETWINAPRNNEAEGHRIWTLKCWWYGNIIEQDRSIVEKMTLFWHNHIPIEFYGVFFGRWDYRYLETLRAHALGNFRSLVRAVTLDHAMLHYLNGQYNGAGAPDENYARELQELFCIGKGPDANYTEGDVQAAARILTGWRVDYETDEVKFFPWAHDTEDKQFSAFYGNRLISGRNEQSGAEELDELIDMLFDNHECALFLCRKLYRFFVHHDIDALTEEIVIIPLAEILRANNYEVVPVLQTLFSSQHFFDQSRKGALLKSPADFLASLYREFGTPIPPRELLRDRRQHNSHLVWISSVMSQNLGDPPNVAGWPAYYQIPAFDKAWITTNSLPRRAQFTDWILWAGISTDNFQSKLRILDIVEKIPEASDPNKLIDHLLAWMYSIEVTDKFKTKLKAILLASQLDDFYWTDAWINYLSDRNNEMRRNVVQNRLTNFFYTLLHQPEYHLC